jgi:hypothetical protein
LVADVLSSEETEPCFEKRSSPLPSPPQSVRRSLLPQLLHRPAVAVDTAAVAVDTAAVAVDTVAVDTVAVDTAAVWVVDTGWVVVTVWVVDTALVWVVDAVWVGDSRSTAADVSTLCVSTAAFAASGSTVAPFMPTTTTVVGSGILAVTVT